MCWRDSHPLEWQLASLHQTLVVQCNDSRFVAWAEKHRARGILVRPDRFIAARLNASADLAVLNSFALAPAAALPRAA